MSRSTIKHLKRLQTAIQAHYPRTARSSALVSQDDAVLSRICKYLSVVDQACLSLSCKTLYCKLGEIAKHSQLAFPRLLKIRIPILCVNSPNVPRNQLLIRLQDRHWSYCSKCLKLHPRKEFKRWLLLSSPWRRACSDHAGVVDICPCISLTVRDREKIFERLNSSVKPEKSAFGAFNSFFVNGIASLGHSCAENGVSEGDARVVVHLRINNSGALEAILRYTLSGSSVNAHRLAEPIFACPHQDLQYIACADKATKVCSRCETYIFKSVSPKENSITFEVIRNLGWVKWPADDTWINQCRLTGHWFAHNALYWWKSQELEKSMQGELAKWERNYCLQQKALLQKEKERETAKSLFQANTDLLVSLAVVF